jgi:hypothetical protein
MAAHEELQPLYLLSDEPIDSHEEDFLSRSEEARAIAGAVLGTTGPFTIGIYGQWGSGKTSLLHHVKSLLEARDPSNSKHLAYPYLVTVFFNAWQHEKDAEPLAHLAEAVDAAITKRLAEVATLTDKVVATPIAWLRSAHLAARALVYGVSVEAKLTPAAPGVKLVAKDAIDRYETLKEESQDPDSRVWKEYVNKSVSRAVLRSFRADKSLLKVAKSDPTRQIPRVVVFIDDMDRCLAKDAFKLLQAIKLAVAQPGFIFVMTLDPAALEKVIAKKTAATGENAAIASKAIYLDKLVQLPFALRLHDEQFAGFAAKIINVRLKEMLVAPTDQQAAHHDKNIAPLWQAFRDLQLVLTVSSQKNPRTLIRRINNLLIDARLAPQATKDRFVGGTVVAEVHENGEAVQPMPVAAPEERVRSARAKAEAVFIGLCLIRDTLRHFVGEPETARLSAAQPLCTLIKDHGLNACIKRHYRAAPATGRDVAGILNAMSEETFGEQHDEELDQNKELLVVLKRWPRLDDLFKTAAGQRWLSSKSDRDLVDTFYAKRPDQPVPVRSAMPPVRETNTAEVAPPPPTVPMYSPLRETTTIPATAVQKQPAISDAERGVIERAIRGALDLPVDTELTLEHMGQVSNLNLSLDPITNSGAAWLASSDTGLKALTTLNLWSTKVTDAGVSALASADTCLKALTTLNLSVTQLTDDGLRALASPETGLKALAVLNLSNTPVTDAGVTALTKEVCGLRVLNSLLLSNTHITDAALKAIAGAHTTMRHLKSLYLGGTAVSDDGIAIAVARGTALESLEVLSIAATQTTDAVAEVLASSGSGLVALRALFLGNEETPSTGRSGWGYGRTITDAALTSLARPGASLKLLRLLDVSTSAVTDAGLQALAHPNSGLPALRELWLNNTQVTDKGLMFLADPNTGLRNLHELYLAGTQVTEAGESALKARFPDIKVYRSITPMQMAFMSAGGHPTS